MNWDDIDSDPVNDIREFFKNLYYERWICKNCAWYTNYPSNVHATIVALECPECGGRDFHHSVEPYDPQK